MENQERLASYAASGAILMMRRSLKSAGWSSVLWGCLWVGLLLLQIASIGEGKISWVTYAWFGVGGLLLIAEGIFVIRSFSAMALRVEALTLGLLGATNLIVFSMIISGNTKGRANPIFGVLMLVNAYSNWKASSTFSELMSKSNEQDLAFMTDLLDGIVKGDPKNAPDLIVMKQTGMVASNPDWRMKVLDGNAYLVNITPGVFGSGRRAVAIEIFPARSLQFDISGETWIGNKSKARLLLDGNPTDKKFEIERSMLEKMHMQGIAASAAMG